ncbi:hypothetical protein [Kitasatospora sp. NPDC093558]|uniref:hypothetical protein n=1 Tax=Kitasatospora sp. NPDC093558 TaxID=3155201 RepID=UPI003424B6CF
MIRHTLTHTYTRLALADTNPRMRRVNDALGYAPTHRTHLFRLDLREPAAG